MRHLGFAVACAIFFNVGATAPARAVDVESFTKKDSFGTIKISPTGEYYAATVPLADRTTLVILRRADNKLTGTFGTGKNSHVEDFWWVNPQRVLISTSEKFGELDTPLWTGEIYAISANGKDAEILVGQGLHVQTVGTNIHTKKQERVAAFLVDPLPTDDKNVIISVMPFSNDPYTRAEKMDVDSGRRVQIARAPVRNATFNTDNKGKVRFARGVDTDNYSKLYYRDNESQEWKLINDEAKTDRVEWPIGFSADDSVAYLQIQHEKGPDSIVGMTIGTGERKELLRDDDTDPARIIYRLGTQIPVGAWYVDGKPRSAFFDAASPEARQYRGLEAAFKHQSPFITSGTTDGNLALVRTFSDRNPGDFYVFDSAAKKADHLIAGREWIDPQKMAEMKPIDFTSRDGLPLKGYLTVPIESSGKHLPLVVVPHGGPFGIFDAWAYDEETQLLAAAGYAVLQVNFRGSGNHGRAFQQAGAREWGGKMQDDLTDATHWAVQQGIADARRICIYGASYGGYAALMGAAREPALYKCAAGYVGVYDLPMMQNEDARDSKRLGNWSKDWVGERAQLGALSPNRIAEKIKVPVFLAAGGEDKIASIEHSKMMERALAKAGVPVETLYYPTEGHGFYVEANRKEFYTRLLAFLARNIGGATAAGATAAK